MSSPGEPDRTPSEAPPAAATPAPERTGPYVPEATDRVEAVAASAGRCRLLGEIARGGMGAVFRAYDPDLGRDLAVKVLLEQHRGRPELVRRFMEEARVGGRLQHPGVAPVHDVGRLADERPFFAMKLVEGRTLELLLRQRKSPAEDLLRFLKAFEQVCQTLAYAHAQGIIHRDLKPLNIMVGAFGEVQGMDWGLSKVMGTADGVTAPGEASAAPEATGAGQVLGTPAYIAPEQARGETDRLDARCDVFGLGAILCTILTGRPPYFGGDAREVLARASRGELADAYARLDACGADAELVGLAKGCLAAAACDRPADAGAVAAAATAHLVGVQERLRAAELAKAAAEARAEASRAKAAAERRARRLTVGLAATVLLAACGVGAGALWYQHDQSIRAAEHAGKAAATERDVTAALEEAAALGKQAETLKADPTKWEAALVEAMSAVKRADGVLSSGVDDTGELRPRVDAMRAGLEAAQRDSRMIAGLETARYQEAEAGHEGGFDYAGAVALYASAFRQDDKDWDSPEPDKAAARINRRAIREDLLAGLDEWAVITPNPEESTRLRGIVQAADPDPGSLQNRFRALLHRKDWDGLRRLAFGPESKDVPTARLVHVGRELLRTGAVSEAVKFFKEANERRPGDFWIAFELAQASSEMKPPATDEAIRYYTAALMLRPNSVAVHINLGNALHDKHELDEAIAEFRKALQIQPDFAEAHSNLGSALHDKHELDEAIAEYRKAIQFQPDSRPGPLQPRRRPLRQARVGRGDRGVPQGHPIPAGRRLRPQQPRQRSAGQGPVGRGDHGVPQHAHYNLGLALCDKHQLDEAIAEYRKAIQFQPEFAEAHNNLGRPARASGRGDRGVPQGHPIQPDAHHNCRPPGQGPVTRRSRSTATPSKSSRTTPTPTTTSAPLSTTSTSWTRRSRSTATPSKSSPTTPTPTTTSASPSMTRASWTRRSRSTVRPSKSSPTSPAHTTSATPSGPRASWTRRSRSSARPSKSSPTSPKRGAISVSPSGAGAVCRVHGGSAPRPPVRLPETQLELSLRAVGTLG